MNFRKFIQLFKQLTKKADSITFSKKKSNHRRLFHSHLMRSVFENILMGKDKVHLKTFQEMIKLEMSTIGFQADGRHKYTDRGYQYYQLRFINHSVDKLKNKERYKFACITIKALPLCTATNQSHHVLDIKCTLYNDTNANILVKEIDKQTIIDAYKEILDQADTQKKKRSKKGIA